MTREDQGSGNQIARREFLEWLGVGTAATVLGLEAACTYLEPIAEDNPLHRVVSRDWEKIYRDQYRYDSWLDWVC